jgi:hypothetical protein
LAALVQASRLLFVLVLEVDASRQSQLEHCVNS